MRSLVEFVLFASLLNELLRHSEMGAREVFRRVFFVNEIDVNSLDCYEFTLQNGIVLIYLRFPLGLSFL